MNQDQVTVNHKDHNYHNIVINRNPQNSNNNNAGHANTQTIINENADRTSSTQTSEMNLHVAVICLLKGLIG